MLACCTRSDHIHATRTQAPPPPGIFPVTAPHCAVSLFVYILSDRGAALSGRTKRREKGAGARISGGRTRTLVLLIRSRGPVIQETVRGKGAGNRVPGQRRRPSGLRADACDCNASRWRQTGRQCKLSRVLGGRRRGFPWWPLAAAAARSAVCVRCDLPRRDREDGGICASAGPGPPAFFRMDEVCMRVYTPEIIRFAVAKYSVSGYYCRVAVLLLPSCTTAEHGAPREFPNPDRQQLLWNDVV